MRFSTILFWSRRLLLIPDVSAADEILQHIQFRLAMRKFCIVSDRELQRVWPPREGRAAAIQEFAESNNLGAAINDTGTRVTFKKLPQP
jgi:hypothetical protein